MGGCCSIEKIMGGELNCEAAHGSGFMVACGLEWSNEWVCE